MCALFGCVDLWKGGLHTVWGVYRKLTHTNLYLNKRSHHHPSHRLSVLCTLTHGAKATVDLEHLGEEIKLLDRVFHQNGYHGREIAQILFSSEKRKSGEEEMEGIKRVAAIPFCDTVSSLTIRLLKTANIKTMLRLPSIENRAVEKPYKRLFRVVGASCILHSLFLWAILYWSNRVHYCCAL